MSVAPIAARWPVSGIKLKMTTPGWNYWRGQARWPSKTGKLAPVKQHKKATTLRTLTGSQSENPERADFVDYADYNRWNLWLRNFLGGILIQRPWEPGNQF